MIVIFVEKHLQKCLFIQSTQSR